MDKFSLAGKTAVLTGAARGLGLEFADALASAGANIAILDVGNPGDNLEKLTAKHKVTAKFYKTDVTRRGEVEAAVAAIEADFGSVDINVNAAGIVKDEPFLSTSDINLSSTFSVNFVGSFLVAQACAQAMVRKQKKANGSNGAVGATHTTNGSIVFIGSVASHVPTTVQNISVYCASKSAVRGLVKPLAMELASYGIRVNSLSPGPMKTDMYKQVAAEQPAFARQVERETLFGRVGNPDELRGVMLFLCSDASSWMTGQDLLVDGGATSWNYPAA
ncbi:hypothetical protein SEUCBS140593_009758 [Sporothrix eucalyptigena]|uniref:Uncharacterized protein n=1 Tax=Sporothrix eucalyptigena TaxID=1812306 RepID=A0ABP0CZ76_9PEZI